MWYAIPKPGKKDYHMPRAFRPISLMCFCLKGLEKLVGWEVEGTMSTLHHNQHAFRKGYSTDSALSSTVSEIEKGILNKRFTMAVFCDIAGAFDTISFDAIKRGMESHNFPTSIINWYMQYISNRLCISKLGGTERVKALTKGVPQGGVLSPLMWAMPFDNLLQRYEGKAAKIKGLHPRR